MDDRFLNEQRRDPRPEYARELRERLHTLEDEADSRPVPRWRLEIAVAIGAAACLALFTQPAVRATAQQLLDLFRVHEFAVVQVDEARIEQLRARKLDPQTLLGGNVEKLQEPGPAQSFPSIEAATVAAGYLPERPATLPRGLALDSVFVSGAGRMRLTIDTKPLRALLQDLAITDVDLPAGLDGRQVELRESGAVVERYRAGTRFHVAFMQAASPEAELPPGVDLARLGEAGLRILGLSPDEARRMSRAIDWRSTAVVPVVASATRFQQVTVNGQRGLFLETTHTRTPNGEDRGAGTVVMWSRGERVYALMGNLDQVSMMQMAESVH